MAIGDVSLHAFPPLGWKESPDSQQTTVLDAVNEAAACVFMHLQDNATITGGAFKLRSVTGSGGDHVVQVSIQTVDLTTTPAEPTGTIVGGGAPCSVSVNVATTDDNSVVEFTFDNSFEIVKGTIYALVVEITTHSTSGQIQFSLMNDFAWPGKSYQSYTMRDAGAGWVADIDDQFLVALHASSSYIQIIGCVPPGNHGSADSSGEDSSVGYKSMSSSSPDEICNVFTVDVPTRCFGAAWIERADGDCTVKLYSDPLGTPILIASVDFDKDWRGRSGQHYEQWLPWDEGSQELSPGTTYAVSLLFTSATASRVTICNCHNANMRAAYPGGSSWRYGTRHGSSGAFSENTLKRVPGLGILVDGYDDGAGGGGPATKNIYIGGPIHAS